MTWRDRTECGTPFVESSSSATTLVTGGASDILLVALEAGIVGEIDDTSGGGCEALVLVDADGTEAFELVDGVGAFDGVMIEIDADVGDVNVFSGAGRFSVGSAPDADAETETEAEATDEDDKLLFWKTAAACLAARFSSDSSNSSSSSSSSSSEDESLPPS